MLEIGLRCDWRRWIGESSYLGEVRSIDDTDVKALDFALIVSCDGEGVAVDLLRDFSASCKTDFYFCKPSTSQAEYQVQRRSSMNMMIFT
jgi:hypothetical protein